MIADRPTKSAAIGAAERARVAALPLEQLNPADPQYFVDDTAGYVFERLRREDPVHRSHSPIPGIGHLLVGDPLQGHHAGGYQPRHFIRRRTTSP